MGKIDRRVRYTKHIIKKTLLELLQTTPYERVTVKELCQKAGTEGHQFDPKAGDLRSAWPQRCRKKYIDEHSHREFEAHRRAYHAGWAGYPHPR